MLLVIGSHWSWACDIASSTITPFNLWLQAVGQTKQDAEFIFKGITDPFLYYKVGFTQIGSTSPFYSLRIEKQKIKAKLKAI